MSKTTKTLLWVSGIIITSHLICKSRWWAKNHAGQVYTALPCMLGSPVSFLTSGKSGVPRPN